MADVKVLSAEIANRIAAGEVVERPASVLKELVDNAIDAGATRIVIRTENAGTSLIEVSDNGSGMNQNNALLCLEQHATSKITYASDLDSISSYGFRGEAIPSIASVSRFTILTRLHDDLEGTMIQVNGGEISAVDKIGCAPGTCIRVAKLFYNVPARKKFLKSQRTEDFHIQETFIQLALSRPDIHMELHCDKRKVYNIPPSNDMRTRLSSFVSRDSVKNMIDVEYQEAGISIKGLCSRPGLARGNSREQRFFINQRPIIAPEINRAIRNAYEGIINKGQFAPCILYIEIDPSRVDINVHPAKREVRFREPQLICQVITHSLELALRALSGSQQKLVAPAFLNPKVDTHTRPVSLHLKSPDTDEEKAKPQLSLAPEKRDIPTEFTPRKEARNTTPKVHVDSPPPETGHEEKALPTEGENQNEASSDVSISNNTQNSDVTKKQVYSHGLDKLKVISFYNNEYLICQGENGLIILSLKAARERIVFEQMLDNYRLNSEHTQALLIPISLELNHSDSHLIEKYHTQLSQLGLVLRHFGANTWLLDSTPLNFPEDNLLGLIKDLIDSLHNNPDSLKRDIHLNLAKTICKTSSARIKFNEASSSKILVELDKCETPYSCPQGRPVFINIADSELKKRFGRN
ncbi:DNA mismatch repair endonuclease MutL [Lentisphaera marina]|uniref:DNA mismatch repair endonuclease MutL n=1 Tax=Lentisphaera marina TaxID=1111041 RepID=UPI0023672A97|nr:DNA mismatch repair endonuclease MutL [Lentisphaera marina]MDD7984251.1 DNA mismatch repair endonuclease MutL [Lentisphaera marina]